MLHCTTVGEATREKPFIQRATCNSVGRGLHNVPTVARPQGYTHYGSQNSFLFLILLDIDTVGHSENRGISTLQLQLLAAREYLLGSTHLPSIQYERVTWYNCINEGNTDLDPRNISYTLCYRLRPLGHHFVCPMM